jgi:hypothetical protein
MLFYLNAQLGIHPRRFVLPQNGYPQDRYYVIIIISAGTTGGALPLPDQPCPVISYPDTMNSPEPRYRCF